MALLTRTFMSSSKSPVTRTAYTKTTMLTSWQGAPRAVDESTREHPGAHRGLAHDAARELCAEQGRGSLFPAM